MGDSFETQISGHFSHLSRTYASQISGHTGKNQKFPGHKKNTVYRKLPQSSKNKEIIATQVLQNTG